jgi:hypothetical protein
MRRETAVESDEYLKKRCSEKRPAVSNSHVNWKAPLESLCCMTEEAQFISIKGP